MINGLNTTKYKIGDIMSYEKKKDSKRLDINLVEPKGNRVLSIYTGEKFTENKVSDSKSKFRDNQVYNGALRSLYKFFKEVIYKDNIRLMISLRDLIEKSLVDLERLQELCLKPTRTNEVSKWSKKELLDKLSNKGMCWNICGKSRISDETAGKIIELRNQILEECFDLDVFNYIPEQTLLKDNTVQIELNYYNHCAILPGLEGSPNEWYFKPGVDILTKDIIDDVLNRFPANSDNKDRFEDIYIPRNKYNYINTDTDEIFTFLSKINIDKSREYTLIFNIDSDLLSEIRDEWFNGDSDKDLETDDLVKFYFEKNSEMFKELRLYRDILSGSYKHTSLKTEEDRLNFITAIEKNYPYLKDCREKGTIDTLLNASIFFKIEKTILPGI